MSSTDEAAPREAGPAAGLVPPTPLAGLSTRHLGSAIRAYARRAGVLASALSLRGLLAVDQKLQALMQVSRYYGPALLAEVPAWVPAVETERMGQAFVHLALAQQHLPAWAGRRPLILQYSETFPVAARDALWFFGDQGTCVELLNDEDPRLVRLGVELAGRLALSSLLAQVFAAAHRGVPLDDCLLACIRMGHLPERLAAHGRTILQGHHLAQQLAWLEVLAVAGQELLQEELQACIARLTAADGPTEESHPVIWAAVVDAALSIWTAHQPRQALQAVLQGLRVPNDTILRVVAVVGDTEGLLPVLHYLESLDRTFTPMEQDVVRLVFGQVPAALSHARAGQAERVQALRQLACQVFEANGCSGLEPGQVTHWKDPAVKERLWPIAQIRLRHGRTLGVHPASDPHPLAACLDVSHDLRRWLYVACARERGQPFALSHEDLAMRQRDTAETLVLLHRLEAVGDEP